MQLAPLTPEKEKAAKLGLLDPTTDQLTPKGVFYHRTMQLPNKRELRGLFDKGLIDQNAQPTKAGRIYSTSLVGTPEEINAARINMVRQARDDFESWKLWHETGAEKRWEDITGGGKGLTLGNIAQGVKELALETVPKAVAGGVKMTGRGMMRQLMQNWGLSTNKLDAKMLASFGEMAREGMKNQVVLNAGARLVANTLKPGASEEDFLKAQWQYENDILKLDELTTAQAAATAAALLPGGLDPETARAGVEAAEQVLTPEELATEKAQGAAAGQILADPSVPVTSAASVGLRGIAPRLMTAGGFTGGRVARLNQDLLAAQTRKAALEAAPSMARVPGTAAAIRKLDDEIIQIQNDLLRMEARSGAVSSLKQSVRDLGGKVAATSAGRRVGDTLRRIEDIMEGVGIKAQGAINTAAAVGAAGFVMGVPGGQFLLGAAGLGMLAKRARNIAESAHFLGAQYMREKGLRPYWRRVGDKVQDNWLLRSAAQTMEGVAKPINAVGKLGAAASRSIASELPFSYLAAGGQEGWMLDAVTEGIVFGGPGYAQGLIHSMGGMPAVAKRAEFQQQALADSRELRRTLGTDAQRRAFDSMPLGMREAVGSYSAMMPDKSFRFTDYVGQDGKATPSFYNPDSQTFEINTRSENPLGPLIAHEVGHALHENGFNEILTETALGENGFLRDKDGQLIEDFAKFYFDYNARMDDAGLPTLTEEQMVLEWAAEALAPGLHQGVVSGNIARAIKRHPATRALLNTIMPKDWARRALARTGVLVDRSGNPIRGHGAFSSDAKLPPMITSLIERSLQENAGMRTDSTAAKKALGSDVRVTKENAAQMDAITDQLTSDFKVDKDGKPIRKNGEKVLEDWDVIQARQVAGLPVVEALEREGLDLRPVAYGPGAEGKSLLNPKSRKGPEPPKDWVERTMAKVEAQGVFNVIQLQNLRGMLETMRDKPWAAFLQLYQPVYFKKYSRGHWYNAIKSGGLKPGWRKSVVYDVLVTKAGNILAQTMNLDALERNIVKAAKSAAGERLYGGDVAAIWADVHKQAENRLAGRDNEAMFSDEKMNFLNVVYGNVGKENKARNPMLGESWARKMEPTIRSRRLDRINKQRSIEGLAFDQKLVALRKAPEPEGSSRAPVTPAQDRAYLAAVEQGDMGAAQRMVDEAARKRGGIALSHGTPETTYIPPETIGGDANARIELERMASRFGIKSFTDVANVLERWEEFGMLQEQGASKKDAQRARSLYEKTKGRTTPRKWSLNFNEFRLPSGETELGAHLGTVEQALSFGEYAHPVFLFADSVIRLPDLGTWNYQQVMLEIRKRGVDISETEYEQVFNARDNNAELRKLLRSKGVDAIVYKNEAEAPGDSYIALDPSQIKSADPVTYDDAGNVVPLSERFNEASPDIRYMPEPVGGEGRRVDFLPETKQLQTNRGPVIGPAVHYLPEPVYHGTPHKVDRFSLDKIGTGEGAQVYGWGLYFAGDKSVAENYRITLAYDPEKMRINGRQINEEYQRYTTSRATSIDYQIAEGLERLMMHESPQDVISYFKESGYSQEAIAYFRESDYETFGNLYTVKLKPEADEFLDWDKPLSEQSEKVKAALGRVDNRLFAALADTAKGMSVKEAAIKHGVNRLDLAVGSGGALVESIGKGKESSRALHAAGIKGIRYLDGDSRDKGEGSYNYVIFDESDIEIIEENGKRVGPRKEQPKPKILNDRGRLDRR